MNAIADRLMRLSPAQLAFALRSSMRLSVFAYHGIDDPVGLERQINYLQGRFNLVSQTDVVRAAADLDVLPRRAALVTFDDGHPSLYHHGLPVLRRHGVPAIAFVVAGLIGTDQLPWFDEVRALVEREGRSRHVPVSTPDDVVRALKLLPDETRLQAIDDLRSSATAPPPPEPQLTPDQLRELEAGGIAVGNHSDTHPCLDRCSDVRVHEEIARAHATLTEALGHEPVAFAYPNGNWDERARSEIRAAGYQLGFAFDHRVSARRCRGWLTISRLRVDTKTPMDRFATIATGLHPAIHHLRGRP